MQDLQLIGVHEDGEHLLLSGPGDERFTMPVNEALRAAIRRDRPRLGQLQIEVDGGLRPRDVQALIRAGASAEEAARRAGWPVEKVHRYEGPILAEREHVAGLAQQARLRSRGHGSNGGSTPTLSVRVTERLKERDVEVTDGSWDSWRTEGRPWTVVLTFAAGGRQRQASWTYDLADRTVSAVDDEARWLSEEVQDPKGPIPAPRLRPTSGRHTTVYDVEAEGGLRPAARDEHHEDPLDLMTAMRKRSTARGRRKTGGRSASAGPSQPAAGVASTENQGPEQATPRSQSEQHQSEQRHPERGRLEDRPEHRPDFDLSTVSADPDANGLPDPWRATDNHRADNHQGVAQPRSSERTEPAAAFDAGTEENPGRRDTLPGDFGLDGTGTPPSRAQEERAQDGNAHDGNADEGSAYDASAYGDRSKEPVEAPARQDHSKPQTKKRVRDAARKTGRPSVPAWDEIMFGSKSGVDRSSS